MPNRTDRSMSSFVFEFMGGAVSVTLIAVVGNLFSALWLMLALGIAHHRWDGVPAFGYWASYVLLCGLYAVGGVLRVARVQHYQGGAK